MNNSLRLLKSYQENFNHENAEKNCIPGKRQDLNKDFEHYANKYVKDFFTDYYRNERKST